MDSFPRDSFILSETKKRVRRPKGLKAISQGAMAKSLREILHFVQDDRELWVNCDIITLN